MYRIDPARADLAREFKERPLGVHSAELEKVLLILRWGSVRGKSLIVNLPGNPRAIGECLPLILPAIFEALRHLRGE